MAKKTILGEGKGFSSLLSPTTASDEAQTQAEKVSVYAKIDKELKREYDVYVAIHGIRKEEFIALAIEEYMRNHP